MHRCPASTDAIPNASSRGNRCSRTFGDTGALVHTAFGSNHPGTDAIAFAHAYALTNSRPQGHAKPNSHPYGHAKPDTHTNTFSYRDSYHRTPTDSNANAHRLASNRPHSGRP